VWSDRGGYVARRGCDASGRFYAQVQGRNGRYSVYFAPWAVSDDASQWLDGFETVDEAMAAADRYIADHAETPPCDSGPAPGPGRGTGRDRRGVGVPLTGGGTEQICAH
jgi:hypothetical protein